MNVLLTHLPESRMVDAHRRSHGVEVSISLQLVPGLKRVNHGIKKKKKNLPWLNSSTIQKRPRLINGKTLNPIEKQGKDTK